MLFGITPTQNPNPHSNRYFEDGPPFLLTDAGCEPDMASQKVHEAYEEIEKNREEFFKGFNVEYKRNKDIPICSVPMADVSFFEVRARYPNPVCRTNFSTEHLPPPCRGLHLSNTGSKTRTFPSTSPTRTKNRPKSSATTTSTTWRTDNIVKSTSFSWFWMPLWPRSLTPRTGP